MTYKSNSKAKKLKPSKTVKQKTKFELQCIFLKRLCKILEADARRDRSTSISTLYIVEKSIDELIQLTGKETSILISS